MVVAVEGFYFEVAGKTWDSVAKYEVVIDNYRNVSEEAVSQSRCTLRKRFPAA
jgi:hypothetical protein